MGATGLFGEATQPCDRHCETTPTKTVKSKMPAIKYLHAARWALAWWPGCLRSGRDGLTSGLHLPLGLLVIFIINNSFFGLSITALVKTFLSKGDAIKNLAWFSAIRFHICNGQSGCVPLTKNNRSDQIPFSEQSPAHPAVENTNYDQSFV